MNAIQRRYVSFIKETGAELQDAVDSMNPMFRDVMSSMGDMPEADLDEEERFLFKVWDASLKLQAYSDAILSGIGFDIDDFS